MISVIIPVRNGGETLRACLEAVFSSHIPEGEYEVLVVDDASTDDTGTIVREFPCRYMRREEQAGPAVARNDGAREATGDVLLFIDADMVLSADALMGVRETFVNPEIVACQGVAEKEPFNEGFVPTYRALCNAYFTEKMAEHDFHITFHTRCGAIRRSVFEELGGFDTSFSDAIVEDEEFGRRVNQRYRVRVRRAIRGRHREPGLVASLSKYFSRSYGSARLIVSHDFIFDKSELTPVHSVGAVAAAAAPLAVIARSSLATITLLSVYGARAEVFAFIKRERGAPFLLATIPLDYLLTATAGVGGVLGAVAALPGAITCSKSRSDPS